MSIIIKDLVSSDIIGASGSFMDLIDKINFNFDQIIINGGGPIGLSGPKGDIGYPGPVGGRGNFWFAGLTPPTHGDNNEVLIDGDKFVGIDGFIKSWNGSTWNVTSVNLMGATGKTGATGNNGYSGGYEVYQGYPNLGDGITLTGGGVALGSTGLTGESGSYPNFITTTKYKNTILVGDHLWSIDRFKNFGAVYTGGFYAGVGAGLSVPKLVLVQETVEAASNFLMSFGAYGLTAGATSNASYGFESAGGTSNFMDFVNVGFKNISTGDGNYKTRFKLISNTIPVDIEVGGSVDPSKKEADFNLKATSINLSTWSGNVNITAARTSITGALSATVMSSFPAGINVGTEINTSFSTAFAKISNEKDAGLLALYVSSDVGDNDAIQAISNGNGVTIRAIATGLNGTAIKAEGKTNLAGTLSVLNLATFTSGLTSSGATFSGTSIHNGLAVFNAGLTSSSATISGISNYNGLASFNAGLTTSTANFSGIATFNGTPNFNAGLNTSSATISGVSTCNGLASFNAGLNASSATVSGSATFNGVANFNVGLTASSVNVGSGRIKQNGSEVAPKGEIIMWYGNTLASIPYGYVFCGKWFIGVSYDSAGTYINAGVSYDSAGTYINAGPFGTSATAVQADLDTYFNTPYSQSLTVSSENVGGGIFNWFIVFSGNNVLGIAVPDLSGLFLPQSGYRSINLPKYFGGDAGGVDVVTLTADQYGLKDHTHTISSRKNTGGSGWGPVTLNGSTEGSSFTTNGVDGGAQTAIAHENRPPFKTVTYLIRVA